ILLEACLCSGVQLHDMALLSLHCGLRAGEIFALSWQDINLDLGMITVRDPKNRETRHAYMTDRVRAMLAAGKAGAPEELVYRSRKGGKIESVSNAFEKVVQRLDLNKGVSDRRNRVVFHTLRHTFASWLAVRGTPLHVIKELMGHRTMRVTEKYSHLVPDVKKRAVAVFNEISPVRPAAARAAEYERGVAARRQSGT
ncbi:MAG: site-specific integrase, partial [Pseudomonadota bacterium]